MSTRTPPRRADARRNYDALVAAARVAFAECGPTTALEEVARRAGVGIGTLYRNFPTRRDLIESVYHAEVLVLEADAVRLCSASGDPLTALLTWLGSAVTTMSSQRALVEGLNGDPEAYPECRTALQRSIQYFLDRIRATGVELEVGVDDLTCVVIAVTATAFRDQSQHDRVLGQVFGALLTPAAPSSRPGSARTLPPAGHSPPTPPVGEACS